VWNHLFPHSVLEGRSKKAGLGSSSKPKNCSHILKQKRGSQPFGHLKWPGVGANELICGSGGPHSKRLFGQQLFPECDFTVQLWKIVARVEMREKLLEAPPRPRQVLDGFYG
jgi:hypothetical protein